MHLVITLIATFVSAIVWYVVGRKNKRFHLEILPIMLGAASIMWMVDGFFCLFGEEHKFLGIEPFSYVNGEFIEATEEEMQAAFYQGMNDLFLGIAVITAALVVYAIALLILDPLNIWRKNKEVEAK